MRRLILKGLRVKEFIHPEEEANKKRALSNSAVQKALSSAGDFCHIALEPLTQGTFVKLNEDSEPDFMRVVRQVCMILEVEPVPEVYICHLMSTNIMPLGTDSKAYLTVPDYVLNTFDAEMMYYNVGNAVTMIKANHVGLTTLAAYMPGGGLIELPKILFTLYLHCADATSDRGGLLASQSFSATMRCHLFELGIPPKVSRQLFTTDKEAEQFISEYLEEHNRILDNYNPLLIQAARKYQRLSFIEAPANTMLRELFEWYRAPDGYRAVLSKHGKEYI